jgi:hypothetical protein
MVWSNGVFHEGESLPAERDGFLELPHGLSHDCQIVEADSFVQGVESSTLSVSSLGQLRGRAHRV